MRPSGHQLGFRREEVQIRWLGIRGLQWPRLLPNFQSCASLDRPPDIVLLHAGGNDLGTRTTRELLRDIKLDCLRLLSSYPGLVLVWSDIVARLAWRQVRSVPGINKARAKLNRSVGKFVVRNGGVVVRHKELEVADQELMWHDGVHLNCYGTDIWTSDLKEGIEKALRLWRDDHT